jgi:predicted anti-sigma-YlaC factor YlaD
MPRIRNLILGQRHPSPLALSKYLEGDLDLTTRDRIETHFRSCARCRRVLASLTATVQALGSISETAPAMLADSIVAALHAERDSDHATGSRGEGSGRGALTVLRGSPGDGRVASGLRAALHSCISPSRLRLTLPITIAAGVVLSVVNMGGMLIHGRIDLAVCLMCAADFLVPFAALNLILLMLILAPTRARTSSRGDRPA